MLRLIKNLWHLARSLDHLGVITPDGGLTDSVTIYHRASGSWIKFCENGDVRIHAGRHLDQTSGGAILHNCDRQFAQLDLKDMQHASQRTDHKPSPATEPVLRATWVGDGIQPRSDVHPTREMDVCGVAGHGPDVTPSDSPMRLGEYLNKLSRVHGRAIFAAPRRPEALVGSTPSESHYSPDYICDQ